LRSKANLKIGPEARTFNVEGGSVVGESEQIENWRWEHGRGWVADDELFFKLYEENFQEEMSVYV
jgi:hypothetical protein